jgi:hypothetical protein
VGWGLVCLWCARPTAPHVHTACLPRWCRRLCRTAPSLWSDGAGWCVRGVLAVYVQKCLKARLCPTAPQRVPPFARSRGKQFSPAKKSQCKPNRKRPFAALPLQDETTRKVPKWCPRTTQHSQHEVGSLELARLPSDGHLLQHPPPPPRSAKQARIERQPPPTYQPTLTTNLLIDSECTTMATVPKRIERRKVSLTVTTHLPDNVQFQPRPVNRGGSQHGRMRYSLWLLLYLACATWMLSSVLVTEPNAQLESASIPSRVVLTRSDVEAFTVVPKSRIHAKKLHL